eukprot:UN01504
MGHELRASTNSANSYDSVNRFFDNKDTKMGPDDSGKSKSVNRTFSSDFYMHQVMSEPMYVDSVWHRLQQLPSIILYV